MNSSFVLQCPFLSSINFTDIFYLFKSFNGKFFIYFNKSNYDAFKTKMNEIIILNIINLHNI